MAGAAPCEGIAQPDHQMAGPPHIARNEDRLSCFSKKGIELFRTWTKCPCRPFSVNAEAPFFSVDIMGFEFGDVVAHIVDEPNEVGLYSQYVMKRLTHLVKDHCCRLLKAKLAAIAIA